MAMRECLLYCEYILKKITFKLKNRDKNTYEDERSCSTCNDILYIYTPHTSKGRLGCLFFFFLNLSIHRLHWHTSCIHRHDVSKTSGTVIYHLCTHTLVEQENKKNDEPTKRQISTVVFSSGRCSSGGCLERQKHSHWIVHSSHYLDSLKSSLCKPAFSRYGRGTPEPATGQCHGREGFYSFHVPLQHLGPQKWKVALIYFFSSLYLIRLSSTPVKCHIFLSFIKGWNCFIAICWGKPQTYNPKFLF